MAAPSSSALDPFRQQLSRQLHAFLSQVTLETIQEQGENYNRQRRNAIFFNTLNSIANRVVELKEEKEALRTSFTATPSTTVRNLTGVQFLTSSSTPSLQAHNGSVSSNPTNFSSASLPRQWGFSETQSRQGMGYDVMPGSITQPSLSPTSKEPSFSTKSSTQSSRGQSSESIPTIGAMSAPRSPAIGITAQNGNSIPSSASTSPTLQKKPSTNFGVAIPPRKEPTALTTLEKYAITTTAEIEAGLAVFGSTMGPGQRAPASNVQPGPKMEHLANNSDDNVEPTPGNRKRKRQKKQWCNMCNDHKEGFRGPHELQRHINIQHQTKKTVFIVYDDSPEGKMFKDCKHCSRRKIYGQDYNAACHLRRAHFNKRLKTDTAEQKEFKQMHPDFPPMEELRPWLRKCLVDVSLLKDPKYIDNQDDALLKIEHAVRQEESFSSDQDGSDDDVVQPEMPVTPPAETQPDAEAEQQSEQHFADATMEDMAANIDLDFTEDIDFDLDAAAAYPITGNDFTFTDAPIRSQLTSQTSSTPRNVNFHLEAIGIAPDRIDSTILSHVENNVFSFPNFEPLHFSGNMSVDPNAVSDNGSTFYNFEDFDCDQFLNGNGLN